MMLFSQMIRWLCADDDVNGFGDSLRLNSSRFPHCRRRSRQAARFFCGGRRQGWSIVLRRTFRTRIQSFWTKLPIFRPTAAAVSRIFVELHVKGFLPSVMSLSETCALSLSLWAPLYVQVFVWGLGLHYSVIRVWGCSASSNPRKEAIFRYGSVVSGFDSQTNITGNGSWVGSWNSQWLETTHFSN